MVIYADILFFENLLANCLILKLTSAISGITLKTIRMVFASSLGALYAVITVAIPNMAFLSALLTRIIVSTLMILVAFKIRNTDIEENNRAFVNVKYIQKIKETKIVLDTGEEIETLNKEKSLILNRNLAKALLLEEILNQSLEREASLRYMTGYLKDK